MKTKPFFIFIICSLFLFSCKEDEPTYYPVSEELKSYAFFKKGSYWIYRNVLSNVYDSIAVTESSIKKISAGNSIYEKGTIRIYSKIYSNMYSNSTTNLFTEEIETFDGGKERYRRYEYPGNMSMYQDILTTPYPYALDTMTVASNLYKQIFWIPLTFSTPSNMLGEVYIAKNVGIIKKTTANHGIWELVSCHIVQ